MRLLALITKPQSVARFLLHRGQPTQPPARAPPRDPPHFKTLVVRRRPVSDSSQQQELFEDLESLLLEGLRSGDAKPLGRADFDRARAFVRDLAVKKQAKGK